MGKRALYGLLLVSSMFLFVRVTTQQQGAAVKKIIRPGDNSNPEGMGGGTSSTTGSSVFSGNRSVGNALATADAEQRLIRNLFTGYSKDARPVINKTKSIEVKFDVAYSQLKELDSRNQILQSKVWLRQYWTNPFLKWNPDEYEGLRSINISPDLIWKPDIVLYNSVGFGETGSIYGFDTKAVLRYDGNTEWFAPTEIHSICKIDITFFPFDEQRCPLKFGSWTYTGASLNFVNIRDTADVGEYIESGEWELKQASLVRNVVKYSCCPDPYVDITYTIHVKRKTLYYLSNLILPCVLLAALTVFTHCLPPESGERMGLAITILLGLTVFMLLFTDNVPRTSEVFPLIGKYAFTVLCEVAVSLLFTTYILIVYHKNPNKEMSSWFRFMIHNVLAPLLCKTPPNIKDENGKTSKCCVFPQTGKISEAAPPPRTLIPNKDNEKPYMNHVSTSTTSEDGLHPRPLSEQAGADYRLAELSSGMQKIMEYLDGVQESEANQDEWKFAAEVLDSFFFWLLAITFFVSTIVFYLMVP